MPLQLLLPDFPEGATRIAYGVHLLKKDGIVTYFLGDDNFFHHRVEDTSSYHFVLASLMDNRHVHPCELERAPLCLPHRTLMNWLDQLRTRGPDSFFRNGHRTGATVMTAAQITCCNALFARGLSVACVARQAGIGDSTLRKALARGAVRRFSPEAASVPVDTGSTKSDRSRADAQAAQGLGTACTRADERMAAAVGLAACATARFEHANDVLMGGLLTGLPALCANGLLSGIGKYLRLPKGFYSCLHILLVLGFMALGRIRRPEGLSHIPPGELGKVAGLDRVPEARTLRAKISLMAQAGDPEAWMRELAKTWMNEEPAEAGYLYVDGHVRVYHGAAAHLPRRYVSRERLCLRGTTDYWVNDALGRPFFVVSKAVTDGLAATLLNDIVPELLESVPGQPSQEALDADPLVHRFVVVFDREGATHSLLAALWQHRIAAITYRKNVTDTWPENEFRECEVPVPGGGITPMMLAERETPLNANGQSILVKEVRRLTPAGHQTAIISTARKLLTPVIAGRMFARWCQENYFAYMMQHYDIDGLVQYGAQEVSGTATVVNPAWRERDKAVKETQRILRKLQVQLGALSQSGPEGANVHKKAQLLEHIQEVQVLREQHCAERKQIKRKVTVESLPQQQRPTQLLPLNKMLADTVKMIAYRAETALVAMLIPHLKKEEEARALVRELLVSAADIIPDKDANILTVRIHRMASPAHDKAITALLEMLTKMEFTHPETRAKMVYALA
jgi:hypothetical protein